MSHCPLQLQEQIDSWSRGELSPEDAATVAAHLATCSACAEEERWLRQTRQALKARAERHPPPPSFASILAAVQAQAETPVAIARPTSIGHQAKGTRKRPRKRSPASPAPRSRSWLSWLPHAFGMAAVAAAVLLFCASPTEEPPMPAAETLQPMCEDDTCSSCSPEESAPAQELECESNCMSMPPVTFPDERPQKE